ncbi:MAG: PAS domain S-box protein [Deltaproteobacteria bacterium]|nr:PAS domain S-box protein [Deltaproteobacteria bacterium]
MARPFDAVEVPEGGAAPLPGDRKRDAGAAVESLLARASRVTDVSRAEVDEACRALGVDSPSSVQSEFESLYGRFLDHCLEDRKLSAEESEDLEHLQGIFGLDDSDIAGVQDEAAIRVYGSAVAEVLEDLKIDPEEARFLARLRDELHLPEWKAERILDDGRSEVRARSLDQAMGAHPSGGLLQGLAGVPVSQYLKILLPLTAVFMLAIFLEYRADVGVDRARLLAQEVSVIQNGVLRIERGLEIAAGDLSYVVDLVAEVADDQAPDRIAALERNLLAFVRHRPGYFRIRFIGATGHEIIRIGNTPGGPRITPESEFQDLSDLSDFNDTMRLEPGEVFVSPIELNAERGALEGSYESAVRLATPIDGAAGQRRGIVVLTVHGGNFLRAFERDTDESGTRRMIINSEGYWFQRRSDVESGVVLERGRSFQRTFPDVWPQLLARPQSWVESREGLFYLETVTPAPAASSPGGEAHELPLWVFVSLVPHQLLADIKVRAATPLLVIATPLYFTCVVIGCLLAGALHRRDEALLGLEKVRSAMMTAALDGIVIMDETGTTLQFNPSAQKIFGYTLEEARGKLVADLIIPPAHRETHRLGLERYLATGEGRIIDKHISELELTVCHPVTVAGKRLFYGFLRDLSEPRRGKVEDDPQNPRVLPG